MLMVVRRPRAIEDLELSGLIEQNLRNIRSSVEAVARCNRFAEDSNVNRDLLLAVQFLEQARVQLKRRPDRTNDA